MVFLGIDGGGSKTAFLLEDETGKQLGRCETGPSNWLSAGENAAKNSIAAGIAKLPVQPDVVCAGFAGAGRPEGIRFYQSCLKNLLPQANVIVETDAFISYVGAIGLEPGVLLIAGTGSIVIGRQPDGTMIRVGGWGPAFSDEGSGFWIGRQAISMALQFHDANTNTAFVAAIREALQLESITEAGAAWKSGRLTVSSVAALTTVLTTKFPTAPFTLSTMTTAAYLLTEMVKTAVDRIGMPQCPISISGSIGRYPTMQTMLRSMMEKSKLTPPLDPRDSPERGAIIWARSQAQR